MKNLKNGFTLAEVLVTLGIIGVVAALTTPALIQNVGDAKVAPRLQKAKATFETAAEMMLNANDSNIILGVATTAEDIGKELQNYMKISYNDNIGANTDYAPNCAITPYAATGGTSTFKRFDSDDGTIYLIWDNNGGNLTEVGVNTNAGSDIPNNQLIGIVAVDTNGQQGPNRAGRDIFPFFMYNDGTLRPYGGKSANRSTVAHPTCESNGCDENPGTTEQPQNPNTCTGSIFDHGMKIIYELF